MIGSGKTAIGRRLSVLLKREFLDLDREMDRILGYSFHKLVQEQGWLAFRELEYSICKDLTRRRDAIIALGGGTVRYEWNRDILKGAGHVILLEAPLEAIIERVRRADRPRVNPGTTLEEDVRKMWAESRHKYLEAADTVYETGRKSIDQVVRELKEIILALP
jgi:shikimate kinase